MHYSLAQISGRFIAKGSVHFLHIGASNNRRKGVKSGHWTNKKSCPISRLDTFSFERLQFPLAMTHAKQYVADRIALIGDVAHVIHPLASQGVNLGLNDAKILAKVLIHANNNQYDIGHYLVLRKYERARKRYIVTIIAAMDFFKGLFGAQSSIVAGLRSFGLNMVNS